MPADRLDDAVATVCAQLATGAAQGLRESKRILNADLVRRIDAHGDEMAALSARLFASDEAREAMTAFLNRKSVGNPRACPTGRYGHDHHDSRRPGGRVDEATFDDFVGRWP